MQEQGDSSSPSFWGLASSTLNYVKDTSKKLVDSARTDLVEFAGALKIETKPILDRVDGIAQDLTRGGGGGAISESKRSDAPSTQRSSGFAPSKLRSEQLQSLHQNRQTFATDPVSTEAYTTFRTQFVNDYATNWQNDLLQVRLSHPSIDQFFKELVPHIVSEEIFWCRYVYRVREINTAEEKRQLLLQRVADISQMPQLSTALAASAPQALPSWDDPEIEEERASKDSMNASEPATTNPATPETAPLNVAHSPETPTMRVADEPIPESKTVAVNERDVSAMETNNTPSQITVVEKPTPPSPPPLPVITNVAVQETKPATGATATTTTTSTDANWDDWE